jgi:hypothetical protein
MKTYGYLPLLECLLGLLLLLLASSQLITHSTIGVTAAQRNAAAAVSFSSLPSPG